MMLNEIDTYVHWWYYSSSRVMSKVCYAIDNEHIMKSSSCHSDLQLDIDINEAEDDAVIHQDEGDVILMR